MDFRQILKVYLLLLLLPACSTSYQSDESAYYQHSYTNNHTNAIHGNSQFIQQYVESMSDALIVNARNDFKNGRIAIGSITMIDSFSLDQEKTHHLSFLGLQVQESLMTSLLEKRYRVIEYRRTKEIILHENYDQMLSRVLSQLSSQQSFHYFLTGTIKYQESGAIVNLRLIDLVTNEVNAATTKLVPRDVFWQYKSTISHNGLLYRNSEVH